MAGLVFGFFPAQVVQTLSRLGVPDALGAGALGLDALAARTGARPDPSPGCCGRRPGSIW